MTALNDFKVAIAFLTRVKVSHDDHVSIARSAAWFPIVGALIGSFGAFVLWTSNLFFPTAIASSLTLIALVLICGGFHQDGLADTFDGLVGGWNVEQRLNILKDSRHGTYGVLAIVLQILLQFACLSSLPVKVGMITIVLTQSLARVVPLYWMKAKPVKGHEGMGAQVSKSFSYANLIAPTIFVSLLGYVLVQEWIFLNILILIIGNFILLRFVIARIGGVLGDAFGAAEQISESLIYLVISAVVFKTTGAVGFL
jgi:adenosylcobinamide-GDP ribazoletransferase